MRWINWLVIAFGAGLCFRAIVCYAYGIHLWPADLSFAYAILLVGGYLSGMNQEERRPDEKQFGQQIESLSLPRTRRLPKLIVPVLLWLLEPVRLALAMPGPGLPLVIASFVGCFWLARAVGASVKLT
ncbi:MAG: hypothetical protein AB1497_00020 [Bacillota bacterium]